MQTKNIFIVVLFSSLVICGCSITIKADNTETPAPVIITATLPNTQPQPSTETFIPPLPTQTITPATGITSTQLNVRKEPSTASEVISVIPANTQIQIIGKDAGENWWLILQPENVDGKGWVTAQFVETASKPEVPVMRNDGSISGSGASGIVIQQLNIRSGPGTNFDSLGTLNTDDIVTLTGKNRANTWLQIKFTAGPDGNGWVNAAFIKADGLDVLPIVSELGDVIGTGTAVDTPLPPTPTLVPAAMDFDSADAPIQAVAFGSGGITSLLYSGDLSAPNGDTEDWIVFTPYTDTVLVSLQCQGSAPIRAEFSVTNDLLTCNLPAQALKVFANAPVLVHLIAGSTSGEMEYAGYTIRIVSLP